MNVLKKIWNSYQKLIDCLTQSVALLSGITLFVMMFLITVYVIMRKTIGPGNLDAIEISGYMMVFVVYGALAKTFRDGGLLRVELLYDKYPESVKKTADVLLGIIALIYCYLLTRYSWELVMVSYTSSLRSVSTYRVLLWIPQMLLVGGAVLLTLTVIEYEIKKLIGLFSKNAVTEENDAEEGGKD
ncbi:MAG: TRAP transporter small permease [Dorea sp.]|jgi:TRAP-type C4-dicarboxylate transport system permease small subunit|nr:TRAP transporter small permease [Dorea sp.]